MDSDIKHFRKLLKSLRLPFYFSPRVTKFESLSKIYKISSVPIQRRLPGRTLEDSPVIIVNKRLQLKILHSLVTMTHPYLPYVIGLSSTPSDIFAMELAGSIFYNLWSKRKAISWKIKDTSNIDLREDSDDYHDLDLLIIYNLSPKSTNGRLQVARDYISRYNRSLRFVINAGTNAVDYFDNYLHHGLSGMINIIGGTNDYFNSSHLRGKDKSEHEEAVQIFSPEVENFLD